MIKCTFCDGTGQCEVDNDGPNIPIFGECTICNGTGQVEVKKTQLEKLHDAIRNVKDQFGDDKCWMDIEELFKMLPEGYEPISQDIPIQLDNCKQYLLCRSKGTEYLPPPRWVKGLPDKPGVWVMTTDTGFRFTITYRGGAFHIKDEKIVCSFGPIPREPDGLLQTNAAHNTKSDCNVLGEC